MSSRNTSKSSGLCTHVQLLDDTMNQMIENQYVNSSCAHKCQQGRLTPLEGVFLVADNNNTKIKKKIEKYEQGFLCLY